MTITRQTLLLWWGLTVTVSYLITEYIGRTMEEGHSAVLWTWILAMLIPVGMTLLLDKRNALVWVWAGATVLATAENYWAHAAEAKSIMLFSFHTLWFLFGALGFAYTATAAEGTRRKQLYGLAALLNLVGAVALFFNHELLEGYQYIILAVIQGLPMLLDVPLRRQQHQAKPA